MIHTFPILEDLPLLHLQKGDVILVEPGDGAPVGLYRPLPSNYATILPLLIGHGAVSTNLSDDDLECVARLSPLPPGCGHEARSGQDRRQRALRLVVE